MSINVDAKPKSDGGPAVGQSLTVLVARYGIFIVLIVMVSVLTVLTPIIRDGQQLFLTPNNLLQVMLQASINAIIAVGMTFVITSGGIDLSVGSIVALCGVLTAMLMRDSGVSTVVALLFAVGVGIACGLFNGILITGLNLPPFIVTLGTMGVFRGLALVISEGRSIYQFDRTILQPFSTRLTFLGISIPTAVLIAAVVTVLFAFVLTQTKFGKYTIAIGGNEETARVAGIAVKRHKLWIYALSGALTGLAGLLLLARLNSGDPTFGEEYTLNSIAASVMGGTSLSGGEGSISGTIVGALIISMVQNAMNLFNVPSYWQQLVIGTVIVLAVILDQFRKRQSTRN
jgi:ribose/xylose/arabinose/galactoside ABC-type transport system permease subunit